MNNNNATFRGEIIGTSLKLKDDYGFKHYLSSLARKNEIVPVVLNIKEWKITRSNGQNNYYWGVIIPVLSEHFGYLPDEMHTALKLKFLRIGGTDQLPKVRSTTTLDKGEWENLMEKIRCWAAAEFNIIIPTVSDYYEGNL